jgi:membrane fusion protein (multidrug efflux system)
LTVPAGATEDRQVQVSFSRTLASLRRDRGRGALIAGAIAVLVLAGWLAWLLAARVTVYRTSVRAHLEVLPAPTRVAAPIAGRVQQVELAVGTSVEAGAILVELDATNARLALARARAQLAALEPEAAAVARELEAEEAAASAAAAADRGALREAAARVREAEAAVALAEEEERRLRALVDAAAAAPADLARAAADLRQRRAAREALVHEGGSDDADRQARESGRRARREQIARQRAELDGALAAAAAEVQRLEYEVDQLTIRAPVAGVLGDVTPLRPGAVVAAGDVIATIVPAGELQVVAAFPPDAIGRIAPGQRARLRLDGFPWTQYGTVPAQVTRVGSELRDGVIRVELAPAPSSSPRVALRHGMTGTVDVEIERVSPGALLLRAAGERTSHAEPK